MAVNALSFEDFFLATDFTQPCWTFAYGSLIWRPCFEWSRREVARLPGFARRLNLWTYQARGTVECPGLGFGLEAQAGACCDGVAFQLPAAQVRPSLEAIWQREMHASLYIPSWQTVQTSALGGVCALTFLANIEHPQYAGEVPLEQAAEIVRTASGKLGPCREYVEHTAFALRESGIPDQELDKLVERL